MSNKQKNTRMVPEDRQEMIVRVASEHFLREGYDSASISKIAAEAGVTRALVYHYFPGKSVLMEAVLKQESEMLLDATKPDPDCTPLKNLRNLLGFYFEQFASHNVQKLNLHLQSEGISQIVGDRINENHAVQARRIAKILGVGRDPLKNAAISAWTEFVPSLAKHAQDTADIPQDALIATCLRVLHAVTDALPELSAEESA